ncbi:hypothetical protein H0H87_003708 [Tephrocybe sp. NHM501043]|nr:hypothetical protein H0H87_003708 [Tephrocybe sp. NHM501043]
MTIQASFVPSEYVFSSAAKTNTVYRNNISPILMEVLQMNKYSIMQEINFTEGLLILEQDLEVINRMSIKVDLLGALAAPPLSIDGEAAIDAIIYATDSDSDNEA